MVDVTGRFPMNESSICTDSYNFASDALPPKSQEEPATGSKTEKFESLPNEEKENVKDSSKTLISVLLQVLMESVFKFKQSEEKEYLKLLSETLAKERPDLKMDTNELIDLYYQVEEGSLIKDVVARFLKVPTGKEVIQTDSMETSEPGEPAPANPLSNTTDSRLDRAGGRELRSELQCKVCLDSQVAVTFVPCGHLVTCVSCTSALFECPVCRAQIRGTIRTYL